MKTRNNPLLDEQTAAAIEETVAWMLEQIALQIRVAEALGPYTDTVRRDALLDALAERRGRLVRMRAGLLGHVPPRLVTK